MAEIRPFEVPWTLFHNYVLDEIMPALSPNGWKILCVAIRQTLGWQGSGPGDRREWDTISYSQFMEKSGIRGRATVSRAIKECLNAGYLLRKQVGADVRSNKPLFAYALNTDYTIEIEEDASSSEIELTKERETKRKQDDDGAHQELITKLMALGVHEGQARKWARERPSEMIIGWIEHLRRDGLGLSNPAGFLVAKLRDGEEPPTAEKTEGDRRRYIEGPYSDLIRH